MMQLYQKIVQSMRRFDSCEAQIQAPLVVDEDEISWSQAYDVVVVGFGGAGAGAALEARENGASVTALERYNGGGSTIISGGIYYSGGGTAIQKACGVEDDTENMYQYLREEVKDAVGDETLRDFCSRSVENFDWLSGHGVQFKATLAPFKTSYPVDKHYLYFSGNEPFPPYNNQATPAQRGHRAYTESGGTLNSGSAFFEPLRQACYRQGVKVSTQASVDRLVMDSESQVLGVGARILPEGSVAKKLHQKLYWLAVYLRYMSMYVPLLRGLLMRAMHLLEQRYGESVCIRARRGVILSTGGFFFNDTMVREYAPKYSEGMGLGTVSDDGSGIQLGQSADAHTTLMDKVSVWRFFNPPEPFVRGVLIGRSGMRVCNEMLYGAQIGEHIFADNDEGKAYLILDQKLWLDSWRMIGPSRATWFQAMLAMGYLSVHCKRASNLTALATKLGVPEATLTATVADYNSLAASDSPDPMGKPKEFVHAVGEGPFYAIDCTYTVKLVPCPLITVGGLEVDEKTGAVLNNEGRAIKGLFAAGRTAVGLPSHSYVSGLSIADCVYSARRAGQHAAGECAQATIDSNNAESESDSGVESTAVL